MDYFFDKSVFIKVSWQNKPKSEIFSQEFLTRQGDFLISKYGKVTNDKNNIKKNGDLNTVTLLGLGFKSQRV